MTVALALMCDACGASIVSADIGSGRHRMVAKYVRLEAQQKNWVTSAKSLVLRSVFGGSDFCAKCVAKEQVAEKKLRVGSFVRRTKRSE